MTLNPSQFGSTPVYTGSGLAKSQSDWRKVSLAERAYDDRAIGASKEPGGRWGFDVALVPVAQLKQYREFDRSIRPKFSKEDTEETINSIADDLRKGGVNALRSPISMTYDHKNKWGYIGEGNHRISAAIRAGITHLPVSIGGNHSDLSELKRKGIGSTLHLDNRMVEEGGYFPSNQHPGNFKEFEGAR
jgi:hypothetical protein